MVMRPRSILLLSENLALSPLWVGGGEEVGTLGPGGTQRGSGYFRLQGHSAGRVPPVPTVPVCTAAFLWASVSQINNDNCGQGEAKGLC